MSRKQKALLQAAAISRVPVPNPRQRTLVDAKEKEQWEAMDAEAASEQRMETDEEKKRFQDKVWNLVRAKWF